jgi:hypothetical protein
VYGDLAEEGLVEQEHVQRADQRDYHGGYCGGRVAVDQRHHQVPVAAVDQEREEREGDAKESTT